MTSTATHEPHSCFDAAARKSYGRLHLPVAPRSNARTRFADNGKSKPAITPEEAIRWLDHVVAQGKPICTVGITGPGDPLAVPGPSLRTLRLARQKHPDIRLCLTTLGLYAADYADEMAEIGLSHVTLLVDAVSPDVAAEVYAWIRPSTKNVPLNEAAKLLVSEQARAVSALKRAGLVVKINTTVYPGVNEAHVEQIAAAMATLGADIMSVTAFVPSDPDAETVSPELLSDLRDKVSQHITLMPAWKECGEGLVGLDRPDLPDASVTILPKPTGERPNVAVVSSTGMDVDLHLGHAIRALIYGPREDGLACLLESRDLPEPGSGSSRWEALADTLDDCFVLLTASAGDRPRDILSRRGLSVLITDGSIEGTVDVLYGGGKKGKKCKAGS